LESWIQPAIRADNRLKTGLCCGALSQRERENFENPRDGLS
jgi:hypothetical protein